MTRDEELQVAMASLLRGPIYSEEDAVAWNAVRGQYGRVHDLAAVLGLQVVVDEADEFAYLRSLDELPDGMPRLMRRHSLTMSVTQLLVRLRQRMIAAEAAEATPRLIVTDQDLIEEGRLFHPPGTSEDVIRKDVNRLVELGYLKRMRGQTDTYEVRRIIKALVTADWLETYAETLMAIKRGATSNDADTVAGLDADESNGEDSNSEEES